MAEQLSHSNKISPWLLGVVVFMLVVILVNALMITLAIRSSRGEIESHPYERGMNYEETLTQKRKFASLGWLVNPKLHRSDTESLLEISVHRQQAAVTGEALRADLIRPAESSFDRNCQLSEQSPGIYRCALERLPPGLYALRLWREEGGRADFQIILE